jgi:hypothetical protein
MMHTEVLALRALARIGGIAALIAAVIAGIVAITVAAQARRWLGFGFAGTPHRIGRAAEILLNNGRFVLGVGAAACVAQCRLRHPSSDQIDGARILGWVARAVDILVLLVVLVNVTLVGLAVGAYGWRMVVGLFPHGPFEVGAYCIAANLSLTAHRRPIARSEWVAAGAVALGLLVGAAVLETFAWWG